MQRGADTKELKLVHPLKDYHVAVEYSTNLLQNVRASSSVDIAKQVFQLHWVEMETGEIVSLQVKRNKFLGHFANRAPRVIGMEACGGSQHWARQLQALGHQVRLLPGCVIENARARNQIGASRRSNLRRSY